MALTPLITVVYVLKTTLISNDITMKCHQYRNNVIMLLSHWWQPELLRITLINTSLGHVVTQGNTISATLSAK